MSMEWPWLATKAAMNMSNLKTPAVRKMIRIRDNSAGDYTFLSTLEGRKRFSVCAAGRDVWAYQTAKTLLQELVLAHRATAPLRKRLVRAKAKKAADL